ncbi:restriction endonuclease subunit S [Empedobacter falsenii]
MMENREWVNIKLGEALTFQRGHDLPKSQMIEGIYQVAGSNGAIGFHNVYTTKGPGITIGRSGNIGTPHYYKDNFWAHNTVLYVKDFKGNSELFLYYFLKNIDFSSFNTGSAVPSLNRNHIHEYEIQLPPLPEQKAIASVLSSLDDKIDLLHQQNQTLEALAETLFRQWFIERRPELVEGEAKEDWEVLPLSEIAEVKNGKSFKSSDFTDNDFNSFEVVKMGHIERGGGLKLNPKKDYVSREMDVEKWILNKGDIIMAMTDMKDNVVILGVPAMIDKDDHYVLNQRVARIYLKDNSKLISNYLLYIQLNNKDFIAELQTKANSGVQVNLSTEAIKESEILIPPIELQKEFGNKIIDLYSKIEINREQIQTLTQLRNTLLPKLMSGEVRVKM